jgi:transcriptional regulator with XRE-family HTH domain
VMDDARIGRSLRVLRVRRGLRQSDVARVAGVSQSMVSAIESGAIARIRHDDLRRVFEAVNAGFEGAVIWRGAALDRLLDQRHADLAAAGVRWLERYGWSPHVEISYSVYGERGSIDILGVRPVERAVVVEEVKTEFGSLEGTVRKLDEKVRLVAERICEDRFGWRPESVGRILVLPDTDTARRTVRRHETLLGPTFPARGADLRRWVRTPDGPLSGILFLPAGADIRPGDRRDRRGPVLRVRPPGTTAKRRPPGS